MTEGKSVSASAPKSSLQTTTVRLPKRLYEEARQALETGETGASSLNDLLVQSLAERLQRARREIIDREFESMKGDDKYQRESAIITKQFAANDRATLRDMDKDELQ
jgi:hypothetical protein